MGPAITGAFCGAPLVKGCGELTPNQRASLWMVCNNCLYPQAEYSLGVLTFSVFCHCKRHNAHLCSHPLSMCLWVWVVCFVWYLTEPSVCHVSNEEILIVQGT